MVSVKLKRSEYPGIFFCALSFARRQRCQITDEDFRDYIEEHKTHKQYKYKYDHDHIFVPRGHKYMTNLGFLFVVSFAET